MDQNSKNNILIKNHLAYLNSSAILEFLKQFARRCMVLFFLNKVFSSNKTSRLCEIYLAYQEIIPGPSAVT